jgi:hypothetical protein
MPLPAFNEAGDLPIGIHQATLSEIAERLGGGSVRRQHLMQRLQRVFSLVFGTGHLSRFILFGSFVTDKPEPNDIDVFLIMDNDFDLSQVSGEAKLMFDHMGADTYEGASIFWVRQMAALGGEAAMIAHWQTKRDGTKRGIIEVVQGGDTL